MTSDPHPTLATPKGRNMSVLDDYLKMVRRFWRSIAAAVAAGLAAGVVACLMATPLYTATTSIFLTVDNSKTAGELAQGSTYAENQVRSYSEVVSKPYVLDPVINRLGLACTADQLAQRVTARVPAGTAIIELSVLDEDPARSAAIADAIAEQMATTVTELSPTGSTDHASVRATIIARATPPTQWSSPKVLQDVGLGASIGLLLGLVQAVLRHRRDVRVLSEADLAGLTDLAVVGTVFEDRTTRTTPVATTTGPSSRRLEAYRRIRTSILFSVVDHTAASVMVTSSLPSEGKSVTALNLALAFGAAGRSVLLIDADLRRPSLASYLEIDADTGLANVLVGEAKLADQVVPTGFDKVSLLPSGPVPPNPAELLGSRGMERVLAAAEQGYDIVVLDSPPILAVADGVLVGRLASATVVVAGSGLVTRPQLSAALSQLQHNGANTVGVILNRADAHVDGVGLGDPYYGYGRGSAPASQTREGR